MGLSLYPRQLLALVSFLGCKMWVGRICPPFLLYSVLILL